MWKICRYCVPGTFNVPFGTRILGCEGSSLWVAEPQTDTVIQVKWEVKLFRIGAILDRREWKFIGFCDNATVWYKETA